MAIMKKVVAPKKGKPIIKRGGAPAPVVKAPKIGPVAPKVKY